MAKFVLKDSKLLYNQYDLSGDHNSLTFSVMATELDRTSFGDSGSARLGGLKSFELSQSGYVDCASSQVDAVMFDAIGDSDSIITLMPESNTTGAKAYISRGVSFEYAPGGTVNEVMPFTANAMSQGDRIIQGNVLKSGTVTTTGNGLALNLGGATTSQLPYATLHVTAGSGSGPPYLDASIQSDSTSGFALPTTRVSFTGGTSKLAEWKEGVTGSTSDVWWRATWSTTGTDESYTIHISMGISS